MVINPFEKTVENEDVKLEDQWRTSILAGLHDPVSVKGWRDVIVTDTRLYGEIIEEMTENEGSLSLETRARLAALAYTRTASYDLAISSYLASQLSNEDLERLEPLNPLGDLVFIDSEEMEGDVADEVFSNSSNEFSEYRIVEMAKVADLRYGENPHQKAALYSDDSGSGIAGAEQLHGKEMSFNNYVDAEAAWNLVSDLDGLAVAIIKHTNPSGVGLGDSCEEAYKRALSTDPVSAFGGIAAFNRRVDAAAASEVIKVFTEVVIAPEFDDDALAILSGKKNLRVLRMNDSSAPQGPEYKQISGGFLVQDRDSHVLSAGDLKIVSEKQPTEKELKARCCLRGVLPST